MMARSPSAAEPPEGETESRLRDTVACQGEPIDAAGFLAIMRLRLSLTSKVRQGP